jgi:hypothetical protein
MELGLSHEVIGQLLNGKDEAEEKADKVTMDPERKYIFCRIRSCSVRSMLSILLLVCCRVPLSGVGIVQGLWRLGEGLG